MTLHLICDVSGSMDGAGKPFIMRTVITGIAQTLRFGGIRTDLSLVAWSSEVHHLPNWQPDAPYPEKLLSCGGKADAAALVPLFEASTGDKILILSDGFWPRESTAALDRWRRRLPPDTLRFIKVGADANPRLKGGDVFDAEELFATLDGWLEAAHT